MAIMKNKLSYKDISILFFDRNRLANLIYQIDLDELGNIVNPPDNYRKFFIDEEMRLLGIE